MSLTLAHLFKLWPRAHADLLQGVANASAVVLCKYEINSPLRVAHFMAQCSHESSGGTRLIENLNYTTPERLMQVWPKRFPNAVTARPYLRNPEMLARVVYNGRNGNRSGTSDGYVYRGRGIIQLTGRGTYEHIGKIAGLALVEHPEMTSDNEHCLSVAGAFWASKPLNEAADEDDVREVTRLINGGFNGLNDRIRWLKLWKIELQA